MKKWEIIHKSKSKASNLKITDITKILLDNRGVKNRKEVDAFLNLKLDDVTIETVGIDKKELKKAIKRIEKAIKNKEQIVVFGDYDVDGICASAILWETLNALGAVVVPYIPHRVDEGYGLSKVGITNIKNQILNTTLIITVDNGIVANEAVDFAKEQGIDVIITDHHLPKDEKKKSLPKALAIIHTTKICGGGVAYLLSKEFKHDKEDNHLELVALATVADLVPLTSINRALLKFGIERLRKTQRTGLLEIFKEAAIDKEKIGSYEIGHIIAPRLNAMGRMEYAMESLRLLCTKNSQKAKILAETLGRTNKERQQLTIETAEHASSFLKINNKEVPNLLFISHESYQQGVIGLVAGKLVEEFYRPAIVVSKGEVYSKASARSIRGFNIIEFIRSSASHLLIDAGGHPMAAGFTVETAKLQLLQKALEDKILNLLDSDKLIPTLKIDYELPFSLISFNLYDEIQKLSPFGMGNPEPTFISKDVLIEDMRLVGNGGRHLKLKLSGNQLAVGFDAIAFGMGEKAKEINIGDKIDIVYTINEDSWNGNNRLQLKIKDIKVS